jgi:L-seryl-tRNA(Ser) seleniumtransferase
VRLVRRVLDEARAAIAVGQPAPSFEQVVARVVACVDAEWRAGPQPLINATGVLLHTNLGRAPLSREAIIAMQEAAAYSDLEYDLASGQRGSRQDHVARLLLALTEAQAAAIAVNNAAAVWLALATLARGKEVLVSRGQAVEIGGGFRVPVILRQSGARLVEVGTTNRTRLADFAEAISHRTAAILHVHSSNFRIVGFTEEVPVAALAQLAHAHDLPLIDDNGSGSLLDTADFGLAHEPTPAESLAAGSDIVAFSGDKLLGGPQAGILLGRSDLINRIRRHPLARALRPDKLTLAALSATLLSYLRGDAVSSLPLWRMIAAEPYLIAARAQRWQSEARARGLETQLRPGESPVGGGSLPGETLPTTLITLPPRMSAADLRNGTPAVVGRTSEGHVVLDLRTVPEEHDLVLLEAVCAAAERRARGNVAMREARPR